jgi:hypothetical protein
LPESDIDTYPEDVRDAIDNINRMEFTDDPNNGMALAFARNTANTTRQLPN